MAQRGMPPDGASELELARKRLREVPRHVAQQLSALQLEKGEMVEGGETTAHDAFDWICPGCSRVLIRAARRGVAYRGLLRCPDCGRYSRAD